MGDGRRRRSGPGRAPGKEFAFFLSAVRRELPKPSSNLIKNCNIKRLLLSVVWRIKEEARMTSKRWGGGFLVSEMMAAQAGGVAMWRERSR